MYSSGFFSLAHLLLVWQLFSSEPINYVPLSLFPLSTMLFSHFNPSVSLCSSLSLWNSDYLESHCHRHQEMFKHLLVISPVQETIQRPQLPSYSSLTYISGNMIITHLRCLPAPLEYCHFIHVCFDFFYINFPNLAWRGSFVFKTGCCSSSHWTNQSTNWSEIRVKPILLFNHENQSNLVNDQSFPHSH